jgi:hypothetical protein
MTLHVSSCPAQHSSQSPGSRCFPCTPRPHSMPCVVRAAFAGREPRFPQLSVAAAQVKHLQETMSTDAATIQSLQTQCSDALAIIDSFEEQAANQVIHE